MSYRDVRATSEWLPNLDSTDTNLFGCGEPIDPATLAFGVT